MDEEVLVNADLKKANNSEEKLRDRKRVERNSVSSGKWEISRIVGRVKAVADWKWKPIHLEEALRKSAWYLPRSLHS